MQGGVGWSWCFPAFLLIVSHSLQDAISSQSLRNSNLVSTETDSSSTTLTLQSTQANYDGSTPQNQDGLSLHDIPVENYALSNNSLANGNTDDDSRSSVFVTISGSADGSLVQAFSSTDEDGTAEAVSVSGGKNSNIPGIRPAFAQKYPSSRFKSTQPFDASAQAYASDANTFNFPYFPSQTTSTFSSPNEDHANAFTQALSSGTDPYGAGYPELPRNNQNSGSGSGVAAAQAASFGYNPYSSRYQQPPHNTMTTSAGSSVAQAEAEAQVQVIGGEKTSGLNPNSAGYHLKPHNFIRSGPGPSFNSLYHGYGTSAAQAEATAKALEGGYISGHSQWPYNTGSNSYEQYYQPPRNPSSEGYSQANAVAATQTYGGSTPNSPDYLDQENIFSQSLTDDSAKLLKGGLYDYGSAISYDSSQAHGGWSSILSPGPSQSVGVSSSYGPMISQTDASAQAAAISGGYGENTQSLAFARSGAYSRRIPQQEIIKPDQIFGSENVIECTREGELHHLWSLQQQCAVCACVGHARALRAICASCAGCALPPVPGLEPQPPPASCDPLPTNHPFQNPLNPCQICICEAAPVFGRIDIKITCQENPQCVIPPETPVIPPIPSPPAPVALPHCEKFPKNVPFPHPRDACQLCRCFVQPTPAGVPEQQILCTLNPQCDPDQDSYVIPPAPAQPKIPGTYPITEITKPSSPAPLNYEVLLPTDEALPNAQPTPPSLRDPVLFPAIVTPDEPVPWPPIMPGKHSPLPGLPPHESCQPYPPDTYFQHPWNDCKVCICSATAAAGRVTVEIDCFTKKSCCVEIDELEEPTGFRPVQPSIKPKPGQLQILDRVCQYRSFGSEFEHPTDRCRRCTCDLFGSFVVPSCKRHASPECFKKVVPIPSGQIVYIEPRCRERSPYQPFVAGCHRCECRPALSYVIASCQLLPDCKLPGGSYNQADGYAAGQATLASPTSIKLPSYYYPTSNQGSAQGNAETQNYQTEVRYMGPWAQTQSQIFPGSSTIASEEFGSVEVQSSGAVYPAGWDYHPSTAVHSMADALAESSYHRGQYYRPQSSNKGGSFASANSLTDAGSTPVYSFVSSTPGSYYPSPYNPSSLSPEGFSYYGSSEDTAAASTLDKTSNLPDLYTHDIGYPFSSGSSSNPLFQVGSETFAATSASQTTSPYTLDSNGYQYTPSVRPVQYSVSQADTLAMADAEYSPSTPGNRYEYSLQSSQHSPYGEHSDRGLPASGLYPSLYPYSVPHQTSLYVPGENGWDAASTQANANSPGDILIRRKG